jgi:uncharacterized protein
MTQVDQGDVTPKGGGLQRDKPVIRILSIDGGGMRGIIPMRVLSELERVTGRRAATMFDVVAGTSTGGVIALALSRPGGPDGGPLLTAQEVLDVYMSWGPKIFPDTRLRELPKLLRAKSTRAALRQKVGAVVSPRRYGNARYGADGLEGLFRDALGDTRLSDAVTDVIVPSYDWRAGRSVTFRSREARAGRGPDPTMAQVARATTAAPTYFAPVRLPVDDERKELVLIDGGVAANNPTSVAYYEGLAQERIRGIDVDFLIVSLGTGRPPEEVPTYEQIFSRNWLRLGMGMLGVFMDGSSEIVDELMRNVMTAKEPYGRYWRFNVDLRGCSLDLDDASPQNMSSLVAIADQLIAERRADFEEIAELLDTDDLVPDWSGY